MDNSNGVQFNTNEHDNDFDNVKISSAYEKKSSSADFLVKYSGGMIRNKEQANYVLLIVAVVLFIFSLYVFAQDSQSDKIEVPPGYRIIDSNDGPPRFEKIP